MSDRTYHVFVGTYMSAQEPGIQWLSFDTESGSLEKVAEFTGVVNPSYLAIDAPRSRLFAVSETNEGEVVSFQYDLHARTIRELNRRPTQGAAPCHVCVTEDGTWLTLVNYSGGSIALFPIEDNGEIGRMADFIRHTGRSVRDDRQEAPHPHSIWPVPGTSFHLVPDLGVDRLYMYRKDPDETKLTLHGETLTAPGSGPRHAAFHPREQFVYVIHELSSTIVTYALDAKNGRLEPLQTVSTLPQGYAGNNTAADIHLSPCGKFLYGSNRGHDSIAAFHIAEDGSLQLIGHTPTMGKTPRNFLVVPTGTHILVANQDSDNIVVMAIGKDGVPVPTGETVAMKKPVCLQMLP